MFRRMGRGRISEKDGERGGRRVSERGREGGGKHGRPTMCFELGSDQNIAILVNSEDVLNRKL